MARARMASSVDGPSTAVMPIARRMAGKAISASFTRINPLSSVLKYPASAPIKVPKTAFRATTENPMMTESCAPQITRDHRLRPKLSVPNAKSAPGGRNLKRIASSVGPLSMAHPRVEQGVAHIHADIDQHKERRDQEQPALDHRIISVQHCLR